MREVASQSSGDLLRRPTLNQSLPHEVVQLVIVQLAGTSLPSRSGFLLRSAGPIPHTFTVASQLAANRAPMPAQTSADLGLRQPPIPKLCYLFTLFKSKLLRHRWDSVPTPILQEPAFNDPAMFSPTSISPLLRFSC